MSTHTWTTPHRDGFHTISRVAQICRSDQDGFVAAYREANIALQEALIQAILSDKVQIPTKIELSISIEVQRDSTWLRLDCFIPGIDEPTGS